MCRCRHRRFSASRSRSLFAVRNHGGAPANPPPSRKFRDRDLEIAEECPTRFELAVGLVPSSFDQQHQPPAFRACSSGRGFDNALEKNVVRIISFSSALERRRAPSNFARACL